MCVRRKLQTFYSTLKCAENVFFSAVSNTYKPRSSISQRDFPSA